MSTSYSASARAIRPSAQMSPCDDVDRAARGPSGRSAEPVASSRRTRSTACLGVEQRADEPAPEQPVGAGHEHASARSVPQLPRRPARGPQIVEEDRVLVGVHAVPEALVPERAQLRRSAPAAASGSRSSTESPRSSSSTDGSKQKKPPLTQCSLRGFSTKPADDAVAVQLRDAELELGPHDGHRRPRPVLVVVGEQRVQIDVGHAVGIGDAERARWPSIVGGAAQTAAGGRLESRVHAPHVGVRPATARRGRTARSAPPGSPSAARSVGTPGRGRSASRATGSGGPRSRPAAWESTGCAPAAAFRGRHTESRRAAAPARIIDGAAGAMSSRVPLTSGIRCSRRYMSSGSR